MEMSEEFKNVYKTLNDMDENTRNFAVSMAVSYMGALGLKNEVDELIAMRKVMDTCGSVTAKVGSIISEQELETGVFDESTSPEANQARANREIHSHMESSVDSIVKLVKEKEDELLPKISEFLSLFINNMTA